MSKSQPTKGTSAAAKRGRRNRQRGQESERELCSLFRDAFGIDCKRNLGQERDGGDDVTLHPFSIQVKRRARLTYLYAWLEQCEGNRPVLVLRADGKQWLAIMPLRDWITLAREEVAASEITP